MNSLHRNRVSRSKWSARGIFRKRERWSNYDELWAMALYNNEVPKEDIKKYNLRTSLTWH